MATSAVCQTEKAKNIFVLRTKNFFIYHTLFDLQVTEKRPDESVSIIFAISEHGIRLIVHTPHDLEHPLKIQDFFPSVFIIL